MVGHARCPRKTRCHGCLEDFLPHYTARQLLYSSTYRLWLQLTKAEGIKVILLGDSAVGKSK